MPSPSYSVSATNYGRNPSDAYYALAGTTGGGIPPGPVEITGDLTVDGNATFKQAVTCQAALSVAGNLQAQTASVTGSLTANAIAATSAIVSQGTITGDEIFATNGLTVEANGALISGGLTSVGPLKFSRLSGFLSGNFSNPVTSGTLGNQGLLQLAWNATDGNFGGIFDYPNAAYNGANIYLTPCQPSEPMILGPPSIIYNLPTQGNITILCRANAAPSAGATVAFQYLFFTVGSPI